LPSPPPTTAKARAPRSCRHQRLRWGTKSPAGWIGYGSSDFGAHRSKIPLLARAPSPQPRALSPNLCLHRPSYSHPCCPFVHTRSERSIGLPCRGRRKLLHRRGRARRGSGRQQRMAGKVSRRCWAAAAPHRRFVYLNLIMGLHSYGCMCTVSFGCM